MFRFPILFCLQFVLLLGDVLGNTSVKPRVKRALSTQQSSRLSVKHLLLELAEKHNDLDATKNSVDILMKDRCSNIKSVGKPIIHNNRQYTQGAWMKDPLGIMGSETIFIMLGSSGRNVVEEFEDMDMFKAGVARKKYTLPYNWDGTGAVVYGPYLYYNRYYTSNIVKYNLQTEQVEAQISVGAYSPRKNAYQWGGYSGIDLAVDEQGLWVLFGDTGNSGKLSAYNIDVYDNVLAHYRSLNTEPMSSIGNAFVACGVIYCIDAYNTNPTTINFAYDTKTGKQWNPNIQFTNQYGYNSMVDYNPREKMLYAWDRKRQVTYPITFEEH